MIEADLLRSFRVTDGSIDKFGTVHLFSVFPVGRRRKIHEMRVYSPILHRYADNDHWAKVQGATLQILFEESVVASLTHRQLEIVGPETAGRVFEGGYVADEQLEIANIKGLKDAAAGRVPMEQIDHPFVRVDLRHARIGDKLTVFWLDDDYAVAFNYYDGKAVPCTVEYPLRKKAAQ